MTPGFDPLTLILLVAAAIVFWRLRAVLGTRTGFEKPPFNPANANQNNPVEAKTPQSPGVEIEGTAVEVTPPQPVWQGHAEAGTPLAKTLEAISAKARGFDVAAFKSGANIAYEMIVEAFAKGDKQALKPLLARDVYDSFAGAIDQRNKAGETMKMQFIGMKQSRLEQATLKGSVASLTMRFVSEGIRATFDRGGVVIDGDAREISEETDIWTFERDLTARDPNWKLVATQDNA